MVSKSLLVSSNSSKWRLKIGLREVFDVILALTALGSIVPTVALEERILTHPSVVTDDVTSDSPKYVSDHLRLPGLEGHDESFIEKLYSADNDDEYRGDDETQHRRNKLLEAKTTSTTTTNTSRRKRRRRISKGTSDDVDTDNSLSKRMARFKRDTERDPYVFNLFELLLTTLENKLRRVETMDRAIQHMARRMDTFESTLQQALNSTGKMLVLLESKLLDPASPCLPTTTFYKNQNTADGGQSVPPQPQPILTEAHEQFGPAGSSGLHFKPTEVFPPVHPSQPFYYYYSESDRANPTGGASYTSPQFRSFSVKTNLNHIQPESISKDEEDEESDNVAKKLESMAAHMSRIDSKLSSLQVQLNSNSLSSAANPDELVAAASENYRVDVGLAKRQSLYKDQDLRSMTGTLDRVQDSMEELNQRFMEHAALNTEQLEHMIDNMVQVRQAVLIHGPVMLNESMYSTLESSEGLVEAVSKLDVLVEKVSPLQEVRKKMDEVWNVLVGTKSSVDVLVPKSEALLNTSQRQERAILQFSTNLSEKTDRIIQNLGQVEKRLENMPRGDATGAKDGEDAEFSPNPVSLLQKTTNQLQQDNSVMVILPSETGEALKPQLNVTSVKDSERVDHNSTVEVNTKEEIAQTNDGFKKSVHQSTPFMSPSFNDDTTGYSCSDLMKQGRTKSGNYHIRIRGTTYWFLKVNCEMDIEDGGWTVIQRRDDFGGPRENFNRDWNDYKHGFGDPEREFYLGNENIYLLTNTQEHILRVELEDFDGNKRYAEYSTFKLHSELDLYKLEIGGYRGNAGNSLNDPWYGSNLSPFSTHDRDNDRSSLNCASMLKGGWWWRSCGRGLNGLYLTKSNDYTGRQGIVWFRWRGWDYSLKKSLILIRPKTHSIDVSAKNKLKNF